MLKRNIYFNSQGCEQDQQKGISPQNFGLITTSLNNALQTLLLKEIFNPGVTSMMVFRSTKQCLGLQRRLVAQRSS
jgi:hypothetical protein